MVQEVQLRVNYCQQVFSWDSSSGIIFCWYVWNQSKNYRDTFFHKRSFMVFYFNLFRLSNGNKLAVNYFLSPNVLDDYFSDPNSIVANLVDKVFINSNEKLTQ